MITNKYDKLALFTINFKRDPDSTKMFNAHILTMDGVTHNLDVSWIEIINEHLFVVLANGRTILVEDYKQQDFKDAFIYINNFSISQITGNTSIVDATYDGSSSYSSQKSIHQGNDESVIFDDKYSNDINIPLYLTDIDLDSTYVEHINEDGSITVEKLALGSDKELLIASETTSTQDIKITEEFLHTSKHAPANIHQYLPWLIGAGVSAVGVAWYLYNKKHKEQDEKLDANNEDLIEANNSDVDQTEEQAELDTTNINTDKIPQEPTIVLEDLLTYNNYTHASVDTLSFIQIPTEQDQKQYPLDFVISEF